MKPEDKRCGFGASVPTGERIRRGGVPVAAIA